MLDVFMWICSLRNVEVKKAKIIMPASTKNDYGMQIRMNIYLFYVNIDFKCMSLSL